MTLQDGTYAWWINCTNEYSRVNQSEIRNLNVDTEPPEIAIGSPQNTTYVAVSVDLNVTTSENANACWWNIDGGTNDSMANSSGTNWFDIVTSSQGQHHLYVYCNDTAGNLGMNASIWYTTSPFIQLQITRIISPNLLVARENESVNSTTIVKYTSGENAVYMVNITSEVPYDFDPPSAGSVRVYFVDYAPYGRREITGNTSVSVSVVDQSGTLPTLVMVNISKLWLTDAGGNMSVNDSIEIFYLMNSSKMEPNAYRLVYTNSTLKDNQSQTGSASILSQINSSEVVLRGDKRIWTPDEANPQIFSVEITMKAIGGPVSGILLSDYLPQGATVSGLNVTYYNQSTAVMKNLVNGSDYYVANPAQATLSDGSYVDVYYYNFSYKYTNWDGNLYDNDSITITYNATVLGGGQWILPAIISGYDPTYKTNIVTETSGTVNVPLFDVIVDIITKSVAPGDAVKAALKMLNVGGPRARVDVAATYAVKTAKGDVVTEATDTFAVTDQKEMGLELEVPKETQPGRYNFEVLVSYVGREAITARAFDVIGPSVPAGGDLTIFYILGGVAGIGGAAFALLRRGKGSSHPPALPQSVQ
jgi:hypothetical protein